MTMYSSTLDAMSEVLTEQLDVLQSAIFPAILIVMVIVAGFMIFKALW